MPDTLLFDLDGTLTDPSDGITRSIQYALNRLGVPEPSKTELTPYIGPPIQSVFASLLNTDDIETIRTAVTIYRERYADIGLFENFVYPDVPEMLHRLSEAGKQLYVATSKPHVYARIILRHFGLDTPFEGIYGSELDGTRTNKAELIAHLLAQEQISPSKAAMVGDRKHDVLGARHNGLYSIGVTYGFGSEEELREAGADVLCVAPLQIPTLFRSSVSFLTQADQSAGSDVRQR